ncbi:amino acid permease [Arthrobacter sp. FW306-2-2C-D06B]|uniref:amino acid permease n=1 Tax=Arthrobacter sp. FW306-2-2C-D06B TaxID=2879618 RepID=UPI001F442412|nr:amino acid permease [Arthrobacter sp. FW306-2-2C-D06B]UKA58379.1 amino acid permease [Arthrobacter sp. FW306-2-2C-D06B]
MSHSFDLIKNRERGLKRELTSPQLTMIALGGAIGTGLFLGSKFAISFAGPSVLLSYAIGGLIAVMLMGALAEMTVAHSTTGSFGAFAEYYISPLAGFLVKYLYWSCVVLAVGTEVLAIGDYMKLWFPGVPPLVWILLFAGVLIAVNMFNVKAFGTLEYWFSSIKVFAILGFILLAAILVFGKREAGYGIHNYTAEGGFFPNGVSGMWVAVIVAIFSYLSVEMIAIAAGEAKDPGTAVKKAFKVTVFRLFLFYILTLALILAIAPVSQILAGNSPFVTVMQVIGIPFADSVINVVVIVAALSAMNSQLYISTRMMFSLSRAGQAPAVFGRLHKNGSPVNALILCTGGIAVAACVYALNPESGFTFMMALSMFGAMATWLMIFVTHLAFRRAAKRDGTALSYKLRLYPAASWAGAILMVAIMVTTLFVEAFRMTLIFGVPFALGIVILYFVLKKGRRGSASGTAESDADGSATGTAGGSAVVGSDFDGDRKLEGAANS